MEPYTSALPQIWFDGYGNTRNDFIEGFTKRYRVHKLVWYEIHETMEGAISREKALKKWKRAWKIELIEKGNPAWSDLYSQIV